MFTSALIMFFMYKPAACLTPTSLPSVANSWHKASKKGPWTINGQNKSAAHQCHATYILRLHSLAEISFCLCTDRWIYDNDGRVGIRLEGSKEKVVVKRPTWMIRVVENSCQVHDVQLTSEKQKKQNNREMIQPRQFLVQQHAQQIRQRNGYYRCSRCFHLKSQIIRHTKKRETCKRSIRLQKRVFPVVLLPIAFHFLEKSSVACYSIHIS